MLTEIKGLDALSVMLYHNGNEWGLMASAVVLSSAGLMA